MENMCNHILGDYWCKECVVGLLEGKDRVIENQKAINNELILKIGNPKHGYGIPPIEKGVWLIKSKHLQNPEHPAGYWGLYHLVSAQDNWIWSEEILEYFGPIPFEVWDAVKKEQQNFKDNYLT